MSTDPGQVDDVPVGAGVTGCPGVQVFGPVRGGGAVGAELGPWFRPVLRGVEPASTWPSRSDPQLVTTRHSSKASAVDPPRAFLMTPPHLIGGISRPKRTKSPEQNTHLKRSDDTGDHAGSAVAGWWMLGAWVMAMWRRLWLGAFLGGFRVS